MAHNSDNSIARQMPFKSRARIAIILETCSFILIVFVVAMRPLISETYDSDINSMSRAIDSVNNITPATTVWFDLAIWLAALGTTTSAVLRKTRWRWTGLEIGWLIMLMGAVISTIAASNQRLAINASCNWLTAMVMLMVLSNLCRNQLRIVLLLAAVTASGLTSAGKCWMQVGVEYAESYELYQQTKTEFWQKQGVPLDDPKVELYERRLKAREASGFIPHSNAQGAFLGLAAFAVLALGMSVNKEKKKKTVLFILASFLFWLSYYFAPYWPQAAKGLPSHTPWEVFCCCYCDMCILKIDVSGEPFSRQH